MTRLFENIKLLNILKIPVRYKNPAHHWSVQRKKKTTSQKALDHFDDFYKSIYATSWANIREALLVKQNKYVAVLNNFSDTKRICEELGAMGAMNMRDIYNATKKNLEYQGILKREETENKIHSASHLDQIMEEKQKELSMYPKTHEDSKPILNIDEEDNNNNVLKPVKLESIEDGVKKGNNLDNRLIDSSVGIAASQLHEFVPATKLKGMDDFVLESEHYEYYTKGADFSVRIEEENELNFPKNLLLYTFEENNFTKFPRPKIGSTGVFDYFVLDGGSILPVLALDLQPNDTLLDMCAAPGGKSLTAFQTLCLRFIVANDVQESRVKKIHKFLDEYLKDIDDWDKKFLITQSDARCIQDTGIYNKILVDVPCTTDRHVLHEDDNNIFKTSRIKERIRLPELQSEILTNALKLVIPGGTVVYSTCSLSPIQNDGVVQMSLKRAFEEANIVFTVKDQTKALTPLCYLYNFGDFGLRYGHIVIPTKSRNWGPMYFCKMVRVQ